MPSFGPFLGAKWGLLVGFSVVTWSSVEASFFFSFFETNYEVYGVCFVKFLSRMGCVRGVLLGRKLVKYRSLFWLVSLKQITRLMGCMLVSFSIVWGAFGVCFGKFIGPKSSSMEVMEVCFDQILGTSARFWEKNHEASGVRFSWFSIAKLGLLVGFVVMKSRVWKHVLVIC